MRSILIRRYPARWRARYGDEFEAILEARPLGPFDVADILFGALDAQLRLRGRGAGIREGRRFTMSLRIGGMAAIVGASLIVIVIALTGGHTEGSDKASAIALLVALAALVVALTGMSAFQARSNPWLVWTAFAVTAVGTVAIFIAGVSDLAGAGPRDWRDGLLPIGAVTAALGSATFGIATYRGSVLSRKGALALVIGPTVGLIGAIAVGQDLWGSACPSSLSGSSASWPVGSRSAWRPFVWIERRHSNPLEQPASPPPAEQRRSPPAPRGRRAPTLWAERGPLVTEVACDPRPSKGVITR
jgi:hypothetical protein